MMIISRGTYIDVFLSGLQKVILVCLFFAIAACSNGSSSVDDFVGEGAGENDDIVRTISFDPNAWDFGSLLITASTPLSKSITVNNGSGATLYITSVTGGVSPHFTMVSETCTANASTGLSNGQSCSFVVEFKPTVAGLHNFAVTFGYGDTSGSTAKSAAMNFLGTGDAPASLMISDGPTFDFGPIVATAIAEKSFTVTNIGNVPATSMSGGGLGAPFQFKGGSYPGTGGTCAVALGASQSCTVVVTFNPLTTGLATDAIEFSFDSGAAIETSTRAIQGTGATPANVAISDGPGYDYGTFAVGANSDKVFTLSNSGGVSATGLNGSGLTAPFAFKGSTFPGTGGSCGASLASGASCTVVVSYSPTATGTTVDSVDIGYNDGLNVQALSRAVQGTAVTPAILTLDNGPTYNFGTLIVSATADLPLTVNNVGGFNASFINGSGLAAPFNFKGGTFPGTGGTCGASLGAGSSCSIVVTYAPTAAGSFSDTLDVGYVNGATSQTVSRPMQGLAVTPATLAISDGPTFNFGTYPSGATADKTFTITNTGGTNATSVSGGGLGSPFTYKGGSYPGTGGTCGGTINSSVSCTVVVTYAPVTIAAHSASMDLSYNNGLATVASSRAVAGTGVSPASLTVSDGPTFDFGLQPIGKSVDKSFIITNAGGFSASSIAGSGLAAPFTFKGGSFPGTGGTCTATLVASATCTIVVNYQVTAAVASSDTIELSYNDGVNPQTSTRDILGTGVTAALLAVSDGPTFDYGPVATGAVSEKSLTVSNSGTFTATAMSGSGLAAPFTFKGGTYPGTGGTCGSNLAGGGSCTVVVNFAPVSTGTLSSTLNISYNDGVVTQTASRGLQGIGTLPATLVFSDGPTYNFGTLPFGASTTKSFTVTNAGGVPASSMVGGGVAAPFSFLGGSYPGTGGTCSTTLAASATCLVVVEYNPTVAGPNSGTVSIAYFDNVNNQTSSRPLAGTAVNPASLAIDQGPTYNFGTVAVGGNADVTLNVTNSGAFLASVMSGSGLAVPFTFKGGAYPGTGGTCGGTLNAGATCTLVVNYAPSSTGIQTATANVLYNNGVSAQSASRALQGTGAAPASLAVSDGPTYDYSNVATGGFGDKAFTITNSGGVTATGLNGSGLSTPFSFKGGGFPGTGGTCTATLNASSSCTVVITFSPIANGLATNTVTIGYFNGAASDSATRALQGTGVTPANLSLSDGATFDYGSIPVTGLSEKVFTVTNGGNFVASSITGGGLAAPFTFKGGSYPGTGGTCGASLAVSATCSVVVVFNPTATGTFSDTVELTYDNGASVQVASRAIQGVGATAGQLTISDGPTYNFGSWPNGDTREKSFTITNSGGVPVTAITGGGLAAPYSFKGGTYPGTGATCGTSLNPSVTCTIIVQYSPSILGASSDTIELNYNNGLIAQVSTRDVLGTSVPPAQLTVSDGATYDFGTIAVGGSAEKTFTVTNTGGFSASVVAGTGLVSPFAFKGGTYPGTGGTCATSLNVAASCTLVVTYSPIGTGAQSGTITMSYNDGVAVQNSTRAVTGTGAAPALLSLSDGPTYTFPAVPTGSSADKTFTLTNSGGVPASSVSGSGLSAPYTFKGGSYPGTGGTCGVSLAASASCSVVVTFAPTVVGTPASQIDISYVNGVNAQSTSRAVQGTAVAPASITVSDGPTFDFGTHANGSSTDKTLTLTNSGGYPASAMSGSGLAAPFTFKGGAYPGTGGTCGASLNDANSCTVVVTYAPTVSGTHTDTVEISYNNGSAVVSATRALQAVGAAPANIAISDGPTYSFGTRATGSSTDRTLTITNSGGVAATSLVGTGPTAPFTFKGGAYPGTGGTCTGTLNALANCTVVVTYAPVSTGAHASSVDMGYNDGVTTQTSSRALTGTGAAPASLAISDGATFDFGTIAAGGTSDKTFTVTNSGGVPATSIAGGGITAPYTFKGGGFPGTGGTCTATLNASSTCTMVVNFSPTLGGTFTGTISLAYNDGVGAQAATRDLTGIAVTPATITISDGATFNFGTIPTTSSVDKVFTLTNTGNITATTMAGAGLAAPYTFKGGSYPGTGGTCGTSLANSITCTVVVTFNPTANGSTSDTIDITYFDGAANQTSSRGVQGTGAPPASLTISNGPTFNFGNVANGSVNDHTFTVTNGGGVASTSMTGGSLTAPYSFKGGSYPGTGGTCASSLGATLNCTLVVTYNPSVLGASSGTVTVNYNDGLGAQASNRAVAGTSVNPANLQLSDGPTYDFGTWATGSITERTFTITNSGDVTATALSGGGLAIPFTFKGGSYPGTGGTCSVTLNASATCTIVVRYAPTSTGSQSDAIEIAYQDGAGPQTSTRAIQGTGATPANLSISDGLTYDYGILAAGGTGEKTFTITNSGGVSAVSMSGSGLAAPFRFKGAGYPGTGGTCAGTLNAGGTCTIVVLYQPTVPGTNNDTIDIAYNDGVNNQSVARDVTGQAVAPASITISDGATYNFGTLANGASADKTLTLTNAGAFTASAMAGSGLSAPFTFKGGTYPGTGGTCGSSLNAAATCTVIVTFAPTTSALHNATATISYNDGAGAQTSTRALQGTGAAPASLAITDGPTFDFGTRATGSSTDKTFTVTNSGGVPATSVTGTGLSAPFTYKGGTYPGTGGNCSTSIAGGASCTVVVNYSPIATGGQSSTVNIGYNDGVTTQSATRAVQGTGAAPASLALSDGPTFDYGTIANGGSAEKSFTLTNSGGVPATSVSGGGLASPYSFKGGGFPGTGGTCTATLNASATCTMIVVFAPTTVGVLPDAIEITYDDGVAAQSASRAVTGTGVAPALLTVSDGPTFDFGPVVATGSLDKTFTVTNSGSLSATTVVGTGLTAPFTFKGGSYPGTGGTCAGTINASATCTLVVTFNPSVTGPFSSTISLGYNDGAQAQTSTRAVQGTGATPASITISDGATYNFGNLAQGASLDHTFTLSNGGGVSALTMSGSGLSAPFSFKGGTYPGTGGTCTASLAATANCTIVVNYNPTNIAVHNGTISIGYNNGLTGTTSTRAVTGTGVPPANLTISDGTTYDYGTVATGGVAEKIFTVTNAGSFAASSMAGTGLAAPFTFKGGSYPGTGGNCAANLNPSATCTVVVLYSPVSTGTQSDAIDITYYDGANNQTSSRAVQGTGAAPATLTINEGPGFDYGTVANGSTNDKSFIVTNSGGVSASSVAGGGLSAPFSFKGGTFPGTGGTCAATLGASATCTLVVTYAPTTNATHNSSINLTYNDGVTGQSTSRTVQGTAVAPASISISDGATFNFGTVANGSTNDKTFTLTNSGAFGASAMVGNGISAPYTFKGGTYPGSGGTCSTTLAAAATCTIVVNFSPTATATHNATVNIDFNNGAVVTNSQRPVTGISTPPATLAISDGPSFDFGTKATGSSTDKTFNVNNTGGVPATSVTGTGLAAPFTYKGGSYPGAGGTCSTTIAASATCTVVVTYAPTGTGPQSSSISLGYVDGVTTQTSTRTVQGIGAAPASLSISDATTYDFGNIANGGTVDKSFTVTNSGGVSATSLSGSGLSAPYSFKGGTFPGAGGNCTTSLAASGTCTMVVTFAPTSAGVQTATISLGYDDGVTTQSAIRPLTGTGVTPAILTLSDGPTFDFGPVVATGSADKTFTLTNSGSLQATGMSGAGLSAPYTYKGGSFPGTGGNCGTSLNPAASCSIIVTFNPTVTGSFNATMSVPYNDGAQAQNATRAIQGTGAAPASISISDGATFNFGTFANGSSNDKTFTLTNGGGVSTSVMTGIGLSAPFTFKGGAYPGIGGTCGAALAAAGTCTVVVNYNPSTIATHNGQFDITYNNGLSGQTSSRPIQGTSVPPASLSFSDGPTYDYGILATGGTADKIFTVTNGGSFAASSMNGSGLAAPFTFKGGSYPGTGGNCSTSLNAGANCTVVVTYSPSSTGAQSDSIDLAYYDGANNQSAARAIQGTGANPALLTISDGATFNYGTVASGSSNDKSFIVTNTGGVSATGASGGGLGAPFSFKGGTYPGTGGTCSSTMTAGATCSIVVTYNPTTIATHNDQIDIDYTNGVSAQSVARPVTGTAVAPATITISDGTTFNFGTKANGSSTDKTFTLTNTGSFAASTVTGTGITAPYTFKGGSYPGTGGSCSSTLAPAGTCTIVVTFAPTSTGTHNGQIDITYNNGVTGQTSSRGVTGVGAPPATLAISDGAIFSFGIRATGSSTDKTFSVNNTGGIDATSVSIAALSAPFSFKGGTYPGTGGTCTATIAASATCTVVVTYAPVSTGAHSGSLDYTFDDGVTATQTSSRGMSGTGAAPATITISDATTYSFGSIANGGFADKTFTLNNTGGVTASSMAGSGLAAPFTFKGGSYPGTGGTCGGTLNAAAACTVVVNFAPTIAGLQSDTMNIAYNDGVNGQTSSRDMEGTGVAPALLTLSDGPTFDFGAVVATASLDKTFTVTNSGSLAATTIVGTGITAPYTFKGGGYPGTGGTCGGTLNASASCTVVVTFLPSVTGSFNDTVELTYNDGAQGQTATRDVQGTGATPASITISNGPTFNFGTVANGSSNDQTFTLNNGGGVPGTGLAGSGLTAPYSFKGGSYPGTGGTCTGTLNAGVSCSIVVNYNPSTVATHTGTITVGYNDGLAAQNATRALTGTAVAPALLSATDGPTYDYGTLATGASMDKTFTISNGGSFAASGIGGSGLSAPFTYKGGGFPGTGGSCTGTLNAGASCTMVITWSPTGTGVQSGTFNIAYNNGASGQNLTGGVQGTGAAPALLSVSDGATFNYGSFAVGTNNDKSFTITNSGGVSASSIGGGGLSAPFTFKGGTYPGTGGTCGAALSASASCSVVVTYSPTVAGTQSSQIDIAYNDGVTSQTSSRPITGTALAPANITISDGATFNFGTKANTSLTDKSFTLTNAGSFTATTMTGTGLSAPYSFKGGSYPGTGGNCSTTLAAAATCTVVVTFNPTSSGTYNGQFDIGYNNGVSAQTSSRPVTGAGAPPATFTISDAATFNFGTRATGSSTDKTFTVDNTGGIDATSISVAALAAPYSFKGGTYPGTGGTCTTPLAAAASCTIVVTYAPTGTGTQNETISATFNDGVTASQTSTRAMTGTGASPAAITISDGATFNFGTIANGGSSDKTFTINNTGGVSATSLGGGGLVAPFSFKGGSYPGTGGNCAGTLAASGSCTVVVTFAPTIAGLQSDSLDITFNNGVAAGQTSSRAVQGTGVAPAVLDISDSPLYDFGPVVATGSADKTITITNSGQLAASSIVGTGLSAPFSFKGGSYPGTGGTCGGTLSGAASCTIIVTFSPSVTGSYSNTLNLAYFDGAANQNSTRDVQGVGATAASITISDGATFNFGTVANGSSQDKTFILTNGGGVQATAMSGSGLSAPYTFKGGSYPGTGGTCSGTLNAAATCSIVVNYNPATIATHNATVSIAYTDGLTGQSATRAMTGTAVAPASLTISDATTYDFGTLATGATLDKTFTVTNGGTFTASGMGGSNLAAPFTFKGGSYPGTGGSCSATLNGSGSTCTVVVTYAPTGTGTQSGTMHVTYNDGAGAQTATRGVTGTGAAPALLTISDGATFSFGTVANGSSTDKSFTITNSGGVTANAMSGAGLAVPYSFKGGSYPGTGGNCSTSLAASGTCTVVVTFNSGSTGTYTDTIEVDYNNGVSLQQATRPLTGTSQAPALLTISDATTFDFGNVANGGTAEKTFTVTNGGGFTALSMSGAGLAAPFTFKGGSYPGAGGTCGATLVGAGTCTVVVSYSPVSIGSHADTIEIPYNDGSANQTATRGVQGVGAAPASLTISDGVTFSYGTVAQGSSNDKTFTLTNNGGAAASTVTGTGLSAPFSFKGGTFPGTGGNCTATLNPSTSCTFVVTYAPGSVATSNGTITVNYNDGVNPQSSTRDVTGTSVSAAVITISNGPTYDFGTIANGASLEFTFTLTNTGTFSASAMGGTGLTAPFAYKGGSYPGTGGSCTTTLTGSGGTCTVIVTFIPGTTGSHSAPMNIGFFNGASTQQSSITVIGTSAGPAVLTVSDGPTNFDFGTVATTTTRDKTFTINNSGGVQATSLTGGGLSLPFRFKGGSYPGTGGSCLTTLNSGASCTVVVNYAPTANVTSTQTMSIGYNDGTGAQSATRGVTGTGAGPAVLTMTDNPTYDYGTYPVGATAERTFTISNTGGLAATSVVMNGLAAPYNFKGGTYPGTGGNCSTSIPVSGSCTIVVTFTPGGIGTLSDAIDVAYNDGAAVQSFSTTVQGTGSTAALLTISDAGFTFGTVANGSSQDKSFTINNSGGVAATSISGVALSAPYSFKGGTFPGTGGNCSTTLSASANCSIVVNYSPSTIAVHNATVTVNYNDGLAAQSATRAITGTSVAPASISISDGPTYDFGVLFTGFTADKTFTATNDGSFSATSIAGAGLTAPYTYKGGTFPGTGGNCTTTLAAGAPCTFVVTYAPTVMGTDSQTATVNYNNGAANVASTRPVVGSAIPPVPPSAPSAPTITISAFGQLDLAWTGSATGTGPITYAVYRSTTNGSGYALVQGGITTPLTYNDAAVTAGTTYYYVIRATGPGGSTDSAQSSGTPLGSFSISTATPGDRSVAVAWTASAGATSYTVRYGTATGVWGSVASTSATSPFNVTGLTAGTTYYFMVQAANGQGLMNASGGEFSAVPIAIPVLLSRGNAANSVCSILSNGHLKCWGQATYGILGDGSEAFVGDDADEVIDSSQPAQLGTGRTITKVYSGSTAYHSCAILDDGNVKCWGRNNAGQLGYGDTTNRGDKTANVNDALPNVNLGTGRTAVKLAIGQFHTCALLDNASIKCWGLNANGQLGQGSTTTRGDNNNEMGDFLTPVNLGTGVTALDISAGDNFSCAITNTSTVKCWGRQDNNTGQLGIAANNTNIGDIGAEMGNALATVDIGAGRTALEIQSGYRFSCVRMDDNNVKCWGANGNGQLGLDDTTNRGYTGTLLAATPINLGTSRTAKKIGVGYRHVCAILDNDTLKCWGLGGSGQLGYENNASRGDNGGEMAALGTVNLGTSGAIPTAIYAGLDTSCAKLNNSTTKCWGANGAGQLALQAGTNVTPMDLVGNQAGEMGDPLTPVSLGTATTVLDTAMGFDTICHVRSGNNRLYCFGDNNYGRMALGQPAHAGDDLDEMGSFLAKVELGTGLTASKVSMGLQHACAIVNTGQVKCWGRNQFGQLGYEDTLNRNTQPQMGDNLGFVNLGSGRTAKDIASGSNHNCAILDNDLVKCWGRNNGGALGYENTTTRGNNATTGAMGNSLGYVDLGTSKTAKKIAAGQDISCAILNDNTVKCWGAAAGGPLGKGSNTANLGDAINEMGDSLTAINLGAGRTATDLSVGIQHVCVVLDDATAKCWGNGGNGRLGTNGTASLGDNGGELPVAAIDLGAGRTAKKIAAGASHTCAILDNDTLKCWGNGGNGRLGQGNNNTLGDAGTEMATLNPVTLPAGLTAKEVVAINATTCAILSDNQVRCFGYGLFGTIGNSSNTDIGDAGTEVGDNFPVAPLW